MNPLSQSKTTILPLLILITLACFGFLRKAQAVFPAPNGGYLGGNTAEGQEALFSLTTGGLNTAIGFQALLLNGTGAFNTAVGSHTLRSNTTSTGNTAVGYFSLGSNTNG
jgi:hypothetical protein